MEELLDPIARLHKQWKEAQRNAAGAKPYYTEGSALTAGSGAIRFPDTLPPGSRIQTLSPNIQAHNSRPRLVVGTYHDKDGRIIAVQMCNIRSGVRSTTRLYDTVCETPREIYELGGDKCCTIVCNNFRIYPTSGEYFPTNAHGSPKIWNRGRVLSNDLWLKIISNLIDNVLFNPAIELVDRCPLGDAI